MHLLLDAARCCRPCRRRRCSPPLLLRLLLRMHLLLVAASGSCRLFAAHTWLHACPAWRWGEAEACVPACFPTRKLHFSLTKQAAPLRACRCPEDKLLGCSRIADSNPHNARHLQPLHLNVPQEAVQSWVSGGGQSWFVARQAAKMCGAHSCLHVLCSFGPPGLALLCGCSAVECSRLLLDPAPQAKAWLQAQPQATLLAATHQLVSLVPFPLLPSQAKAWVQAQAQATLLRDCRRGFLHARCLSMFWGFADDMFISIRCAGGWGQYVGSLPPLTTWYGCAVHAEVPLSCWAGVRPERRAARGVPAWRLGAACRPTSGRTALATSCRTCAAAAAGATSSGAP